MPFGETVAHKQQCESTEIEIRVARSMSEVEALREVWAGWPGHRDSDIDFYLMIVRSCREVVRPHVIALYRAGRPDAILVGRLEKKRLRFGVGYLPGFGAWARCLTFVYGALHGDASPENTRYLVREVLNCLRRGEADLAMLEFVPLDSTLYQFAKTLPCTLQRDPMPAPQGHITMSVPDRIELVYGRMSRERRKHLRASVRKIQSGLAGAVKIICYRHLSELDRLFCDTERIARKTYQRGLGVGFADTPDVRARLSLAARKGWLRAYLLYLGARPCAFWIGMNYCDTFHSEYMGFDPEFHQLSPGMVLVMQVIESFCNHTEGDAVRQLDFGLGEAEYKSVLGDRTWLEASAYIFSPNLKGLELKGLRLAAGLIDRSARRVLASTSLFARVKRRWRNRLAKRSREIVHSAKVTRELSKTS